MKLRLLLALLVPAALSAQTSENQAAPQPAAPAQQQTPPEAPQGESTGEAATQPEPDAEADAPPPPPTEEQMRADAIAAKRTPALEAEAGTAEELGAEPSPGTIQLPPVVAGRVDATLITGSFAGAASGPPKVAIDQGVPVTEVELDLPVDPEAGQIDREAHLHLQPLDPDIVRRKLAIQPSPEPLPPLLPLEAARRLEAEGLPRREYDRTRDVVVTVNGQQAHGFPYVTLPVLFVRNTPDLLDQESRDAIQRIADLLLEAREREADAVFEIEAHTSTDGPAEFNMRLSAERAKRVYDQLTQRYKVPAGMLRAYGYGQNYALFPDGTEEQKVIDRRILIVRAR